MKTLKEGLLRAGFKQSENSLRSEKEAEAAEYLAESDREQRHARHEAEQVRILAKLNETSSVSKFRVLSRKLLLSKPSLIYEVVRIAHARGIQAMKKEGGGALIAQLLQARQAIGSSGSGDDEKRRIVEKTISKH